MNNKDVTAMKDDKALVESYTRRGYDDMLLDCRTSYYRAVKLVPELYKWLRFIGKYTHKEAIAKMSTDLGDLPGFSRRTINRYLPNDVPDVPRRIRPSWRKNRDTNIQAGEELMGTEHPVAISTPQNRNDTWIEQNLERLLAYNEDDSPYVRCLKGIIRGQEEYVQCLKGTIRGQEELLEMYRKNHIEMKALLLKPTR